MRFSKGSRITDMAQSLAGAGERLFHEKPAANGDSDMIVAPQGSNVGDGLGTGAVPAWW